MTTDELDIVEQVLLRLNPSDPRFFAGPIPKVNESDYCNSLQPDIRCLRCTRMKGHSGRHVAHTESTGKYLADWKREG